MHLLRYVLVAACMIAVIGLAVANRHYVPVSIDPVGGGAASPAFAMPLYWVIFLAFAGGAMLGAAIMFRGQRKWRLQARSERRKNKWLLAEARRRGEQALEP